nr:spore germination protein [Neobacillus fumarioli]
MEKKQETAPVQETDFTGILTTDLELVRREIGHNSDVNIREFKLGYTEIRAAIIFISGLSDKELIDSYILKSLMLNFPAGYSPGHHSMGNSTLKEFMITHVLTISELKEVSTLNELITGVLKGKTALLIDGSPISFILGTIKEKQRQSLFLF